MFRIGLVSIAVVATLWPGVLAAQSPEPPSDGVRVGDRWVFDRRDELSDLPKDTYTRIVTAVSEKEIVTDFYVRGHPAKTVMIFRSQLGPHRQHYCEVQT